MAIVVALGANLPSPEYGAPVETLEAAVQALGKDDIEVIAQSHWYRSAAVPVSEQPDYINGIVLLKTNLSAVDLLTRLHDIEQEFGRMRVERNEARILDLDLIDYEGVVHEGLDGPILPHPRMQDRAFVLLPLQEVAPDWRHPVLQRSVAELIGNLPPDAVASPLDHS